MISKVLIGETAPDHLLASLEGRDVALWLPQLPAGIPQDTLLRFLGLPWQLIVCEDYDATVFKALVANASYNDPMTRKRGFVQVIEDDPSRVELPQRCLPIYLLNGRNNTATSDFQSRLRRMTMLDNVRRSRVREVLVLSSALPVVPADLAELWVSGFRSGMTVVSASHEAEQSLNDWRGDGGPVAANLVRSSIADVVADILSRYTATYPEDRRVTRIRDQHGAARKIDVTEADEPERPIFEHYALLEERHLAPLLPEDLSAEDLVEFFRNPETSWRPYAAGLPWVRDHQVAQNLTAQLRKLDTIGSEANCVAYVASEPGAGGTTLARTLAWSCARDGYPVLMAKPLSFVPEALPVVNFLNRVHAQVEGRQPANVIPANLGTSEKEIVDASQRRYEAPWIIVFDSTHWQHRSNELVRFRNELERSGRPACILIVTGPILSLPFYNTSVFKQIAVLNHAIDQEQARELGQHLNKFLRVHNRDRQLRQWEQFYEDHAVRYVEGTATFWVALSFWIQGQYDLTESIQEWMYRAFKEHATERDLQAAILEIAAMSSERFPLPEVLLPQTQNQWPIAHRLDDLRSTLAGLGLVRLAADGEKYWALVHDILGRFLINALFYDFPLRAELGFAEASDAEHLRFLILRQISRKVALGEKAYRSIGEDFATAIFKIDPDHGHATFSRLWRAVLTSLDSMPQSLRDTSRVFRHHVSVSRRRVAKLGENYYGVSVDDKVELLRKAVEDINYALTFIEYSPGSESNLNLYNSLANAYFDLADAEESKGADRSKVAELRRLANEATRKAYAENPTNTYVIETYVKDLLQQAKGSSAVAIERCVEALGIVFSALGSNEKAYRASQLGNLADQALAILFKQTPRTVDSPPPKTPAEVLVRAWVALAKSKFDHEELDLSNLPAENRKEAIAILSEPAGHGNLQVIRLTFDLVSTDDPYGFQRQLDLVEQLQATNYRASAQLRLEYAILLFQVGRAAEGDKVFRALRRLWRDSEQFVQVPNRLRWLCNVGTTTRRTVQAIVASDHAHRAMARVQEFGNSLVPFRPEEHGFRDPRPGIRFVSHVSFGHNGPFLTPGTTPAVRTDGG